MRTHLKPSNIPRLRVSMESVYIWDEMSLLPRLISHVYVFMHMTCAYEWTLDTLELELQAVVSCPMWVLRTELGSSGRAAQALNPGDSPVQIRTARTRLPASPTTVFQRCQKFSWFTFVEQSLRAWSETIPKMVADHFAVFLYSIYMNMHLTDYFSICFYQRDLSVLWLLFFFLVLFWNQDNESPVTLHPLQH